MTEVTWNDICPECNEKFRDHNHDDLNKCGLVK